MLTYTRMHTLSPTLASAILGSALMGCDPGYVGDLEDLEAADASTSSDGVTSTTAADTTTGTTGVGETTSTSALPADTGGEESTTAPPMQGDESSTGYVDATLEDEMPFCLSLIDDFADGDGILPATDGRNGVWKTFNDSTGSVEPRPDEAFEPILDGPISLFAAQVRTFGGEGAAGLEVELNGGEPYDASAYDGIAFHVRSPLADGLFDVYLASNEPSVACSDGYCLDEANYGDGGLSTDAVGGWETVLFPQTIARLIREELGEEYYQYYYPGIAEDLALVDPAAVRSIRWLAPQAETGMHLLIDAVCFIKMESLYGGFSYE